MKKIKYQGGITKRLTQQKGFKNREKFLNLFEADELKKVIKELETKAEKIDMSICSFSSSRDKADQILSIMSFIRYAGIPHSWNLYSDGSHSEEEIALIENNFSFVKVITTEWNDFTTLPNLKNEKLLPYADYILHYAKEKPLGKRLYYYLNQEINVPTLFLDADILFFELIKPAFDMILSEDVAGWFLPDYKWGCLDSRYMEKVGEQAYQINGGFFIFNKPLETLEIGMDFLVSLNKEYEYFSDQNVFHIQFREAGFMPLDPRIFVLNSADQFDFSDIMDREFMAIRHYTGPVRHKMWQRGWKYYLNLE